MVEKQNNFFIHCHLEGNDLSIDENIVLTAKQIADYRSKLKEIDPNYESIYYTDYGEEDLYIKAEDLIAELDSAKEITEEEIKVLEKFIDIEYEFTRIDEFIDNAKTR